VPDRRGWSFAAIGVLLGLAAGFAAWGGRSEASGTVTASPSAKLTPVAAPVEGGLAPEFGASTVAGGKFQMSESRGRVVVLNFWATWCEPCRAEMPLLETRFGDEAPSGVLVVGIDSDDTLAQVRAYGDALKLTFPLLLDPDGEVQALYRVRGYPTTFFVDEAGVIRHVHVGAMDAETLGRYLYAMGLN
jgi:peroxiredoxin